MECANDIAYDGVESESALCYNASFGKICTGEQFRVLFTLMNQSGQHAVENLKMRVAVQRVNPDPEQAAKEKQPKEEVLMSETIKVLPARGQLGFIFIFKVDFQANYFMMIETDYTSPFFSEQLKRVIGSYPDLDQRALQSNQFEVDFNRKTVIRKFNKKYKFEAQLPFEVKKSISLKNVRPAISFNTLHNI